MRTKIIADIGANHMGDMAVAEALVRAAAEAGVDTVKFQSWRADRLRPDFPDYEAAYRRHRRTELSDEDHRRLIGLCRDCGVEFLTTCFDLGRVDFLAGLGLRSIKVASPDSTSFRLLDRLLERFEHVIISTGMTPDEELDRLLDHVRGRNVTILHCVSLYPTPPERVNLERMLRIREQGFRAGFSDHSLGTEAGRLAIALGAEILEKHITLSRRLPGKDQAISTTPEEFRELADWARTVERLRGTAQPGLSPAEEELRRIYVGKWGDNR